jgi:excisionase family DNA binding protein
LPPTDNLSPSPSAPLTLTIPAPLLEQIAARAAQLVLAQLQPDLPLESPYLTVPEAAAYARCKRQRIDDLLSSHRLTRYKEGRRTLVLKAELEARLQGRQPPDQHSQRGPGSR